jgi:hypothetical protein
MFFAGVTDTCVCQCVKTFAQHIFNAWKNLKNKENTRIDLLTNVNLYYMYHDKYPQT